MTDPDPRIGDLMARRVDPHTRVALLGFPSDEGVRRNGGRPGAAGGPTAIREALFRMTPGADGGGMTLLLAQTADAGDVEVTGNLEADQEALAGRVAELLHSGAIPIILGGGHETAYGHFLGYARTGRRVAILNWDAHADVRQLKEGVGHSGSPFRQALEHQSGLCARYDAAGLMPWRVAADHAAYLRRRGGSIAWLHELTDARIAGLAGGQEASPAFASFDLDLVDASAAPGVSAPGVGGLAPALWLRAALECGRNPRFTSFDLVELNPAFDESGRTAMLAALTVWHILRGIASR